jgi:hypothetical protein
MAWFALLGQMLSLLLFLTGVDCIVPFEPWLFKCDDNPINAIHSGFPYFVMLAEASSANATTRRQFIISLCNRTDKTPMNTTTCPDSQMYFVAVWDADGKCTGSFNQPPVALAGNGTAHDPLIVEFTSNVTSKKFSLQIECNQSANSSIDVSSFDDLTPSMMVVQAQSSDLCPTPMITPTPSETTSGSSSGVSPSTGSPNRAGIAAGVVIVVCGVIGFAVWYRRRQISYRSLFQNVEQDEAGGGDLDVQNDVHGSS